MYCCEQKTQSFAPSPTVAAINAAVSGANASSPTPAAPVIKSIDEYNQSNPDAPTAVKSVEKMLAQKAQPILMKSSSEDRV